MIIGIVTYNSTGDIDTCLERLQNQTYTNFDIVLLDNASQDGTSEHVAERWSQYKLIRRTENIGFGNGHNEIIAATDSLYYLPLNPDAILTRTYIEEMVKVMEEDETIGSVAGKLYYIKDESEIEDDSLERIVYTAGHASFRDGYAINIGNKLPDHPDYRVKREVFGANAAAPLYRRAMLEDIQFTDGECFDKSIFLYHEDADLDWRARLLGWKCVFTPYAVGYHEQGASGGASVKHIRNLITAVRYYSIFKHAFLFDLMTFNIPAFVVHIIFMLITDAERAVTTLRFITAHRGEIMRKRKWLASRRKITRAELQAWYEWANDQTGEKSYSYLARFWRAKILQKSI